MRGATAASYFLNVHIFQFQSTLPVRGATLVYGVTTSGAIFQSTLPVRGATVCGVKLHQIIRHFNPRSPCGERRELGRDPREVFGISIHAPRAGSDSTVTYNFDHVVTLFQSTLPVRGATIIPFLKSSFFFLISIHAPRAGSDA